MIRVGICGYGNLGRGAEFAVSAAPDMKLVGIFTRRDPSIISANHTVYHIDELNHMVDHIDVLILCGGSATDLMTQSPKFASKFNIVDSFDNHNRIPEHFANVNQAAMQGKKTAIISSGWDPGIFSLQRVFSEAFLPQGETYTFWGKGVSQGHSDAVRRIPGVIDAVQYTIPIETAIAQVRNGELPHLSTREKHLRVCYVVAEDPNQESRIREEIETMPDYFQPYDTEVHFLSQEEFNRDHKTAPHGGFVIRSGSTTSHRHIYEFSLQLDSNPEFTASVLVAYARAAKRLNDVGTFGASTVLEIPPYLLSTKSIDELRKVDL